MKTQGITIVLLGFFAGALTGEVLQPVCDKNSSSSVAVRNDAFCDCERDSVEEEPDTGACSFHSVGKLVFQCKKDIGAEPKFLFASRLSDGICDCCDGSDENVAINGGIVCADTCESSFLVSKRSALLWHRTVQAGKHKRQELLNALYRKRKKETEMFSNLEDQLKEIGEMRLKMKFYDEKYSHRESSERFRLLRERLINCASGEREFCEFFHPGFFSDDELSDFDIPEAQKKNWKPRAKILTSPSELAYLNEMSGTKRVRASVCQTRDIFRDDMFRICVTAGELLTYLESSAGSNPVRIRHHERHLFGKFVDEGEYGYMMGACALGEFFAIVASPITLMVYGASVGLSHVQTVAWQYVEACNEEAGKEDEGGGKLPAALVSACRTLVNMYTPGTVESNVMVYLDWSSYSALARLYDFVLPYVEWYNTLSRIVWYAPSLYHQFYFTNASVALPEARMNCLLRAGIQAAEKETLKLSAKLEEERRAQEALKKSELIAEDGTEAEEEDSTDDSPSGEKSKPKRRANKKKRPNKKNSKSEERVDYGFRKEWEAVRGVCLEKEVASYQYKFCFFKEVKQGTTLLGKFSGWGTRADFHAREEERKSKEKQQKSRKTKLVEVAVDGIELLGDLTGLKPDVGADEAPFNSTLYETQVSLCVYLSLRDLDSLCSPPRFPPHPPPLNTFPGLQQWRSLRRAEKASLRANIVSMLA